MSFLDRFMHQNDQKQKFPEASPVTKLEVARQPLIESPCCEAPSSSLTRSSNGVYPNGTRRCVRCSQPFCHIELTNNRRSPFKAVVGVRNKIKQGNITNDPHTAPNRNRSYTA